MIQLSHCSAIFFPKRRTTKAKTSFRDITNHCGYVSLRWLTIVCRQKLQSSFRPSRHWGPRDPIAHHYWLARREEFARNLPRTVYRRRLGQFSGKASSVNVAQTEIEKGAPVEGKKRSNSDDWLYTVCRRGRLEELYPQLAGGKKNRSKSLDWAASTTIRSKCPSVLTLGAEISFVGDPVAREINNNVAEPNNNFAVML